MLWRGADRDGVIRRLDTVRKDDDAPPAPPRGGDAWTVAWVLLNLDFCASQVAAGALQGPERPQWARYYARFGHVRLSRHQKFVVRRLCEQLRSGYTLEAAFHRIAVELDANWYMDVVDVFFESIEKVQCAPDVLLPDLFKQPCPSRTPARARLRKALAATAQAVGQAAREPENQPRDLSFSV